MKTASNSNFQSLRSNVIPEKLVMTSTLLALSQLTTQAAPPAPAEKKKEDGTTTLPEMVVQADGTKKLYKPENLATPKYTVPLRDVPQTVTAIPKEVMQEQGSSSLRDVLRNVPGISIQAGEGGVPPGDNLAIRGFNARTDLFVDNVRDFGGYSRDPFNIEQVEVTKGPSSTSGGRGSTGGSINLSSKMPKLEKSYGILLGGGTDSYTRATVDINQPIPALSGTAVRLNTVYHHQDIPGRDVADQERWGFAPSITFGLGTDTRFTLSYFHLQQSNTPDYGLPWVPRDNPLTPANENITGLPSGRVDVNDRNYYGLQSRDYDKTSTDIVTAIYEHDITEDLKLKNTLRLGQTENDFIITAPRFFGSLSRLPQGADPTSVNPANRNRDQSTSIISNQTDVRYDFNTGSVKHQLVASLEVSREDTENRTRTDLNVANQPALNLRNPNSKTPYVSDFQYNDGFTEATADTVAISLFDTVKLNDQWMVSGGVRWDSFDVEYQNRAATVNNVPGLFTDIGRKDEVFSYRGAVTFKPLENGSVYLGYGTSFNPSAEALTLTGTPVPPSTTLSTVDLEPEKNETIELGTKWDLLDEQLTLTAAIFRTDKTNARTEDPADPTDLLTLDGEQRIQGFEFGFSGQITEKWRVIGGYAYLDSEIRASKNEFELGSETSNTPQNSFNLWTVHDLPAGFQVGLGAQYVGSRYNNTNSATRQEAPSYTTFDALVGYKVNDNVSFRLNAYNLLDKDYIDRVGGGHYIPGQGRSVTLTADIKF
ncbi:MAG: TonB-dependent siderophore receptor [Akkermansiaceae bacterium]|nr:TonB-dependent siderophore receptor [Akkermansiaceae bacterium]